MSGQKPTLLDLMTILPGLHPRHLVDLDVTTIPTLRLVSKDISILSLTAVQQSMAHFGVEEAFPPFPKPAQLVKILAGAQLKKLYVSVSIVSGTFYTGAATPSVAQQLSFCRSQEDCWLAGMNKGLLSVTELTLQVNHLRVGDDDNLASTTLPGGALHPSKVPGLDSFKGLIRSMFTALAAALPNLISLSLQGPCWDAALSVFGTSCPKLSTLHTQALQVPVSALTGLGGHLPNLTSFSSRNTYILSTEQRQLGMETNAILLELQHCPKLASLCLSFPTPLGFSLGCTPASWYNLPASLQQLEIGCPVAKSWMYEAMLSRMKGLRLHVHPHHFPHMLQASTLLNSLEITGERPYLRVHCHENLNEPPLSALMKQRLSNGVFHLDSHALFFSGTVRAIMDTLAWFPQARSCKDIVLEFLGGQKVNCLEHVPRLFPGVRRLMLQGNMLEAPHTGMDMVFFKPLSECLHLEEVQIRCRCPRLTTAGLVKLWVKHASLCRLGLTPHARVDTDQLQSELRRQQKNPKFAVSCLSN